jgi:hypothetical protein
VVSKGFLEWVDSARLVLKTKTYYHDGWRPEAPDFEAAALRACELVVSADPRIGKVPGSRRASAGTKMAMEASKDAKLPNTPRKVTRGRDQQQPRRRR